MGYKQVMIVRKDLDMGKGKIAAQASHASLEAYKKADSGARKEWERGGSKKVVLKVNSLEELEAVYGQAKKTGLPCALIRDAGRTQLEAGTPTAVGIGPADEKEIDRITGKLKML